MDQQVHLLKAMVFPVVMYGHESWTIKEAESRRITALELWCWWRLLRVPDAGKEWVQEEERATEDEVVGWHHWLNGHQFEQTLGDNEGQGRMVCFSPSSCKELDTTDDWTTTKIVVKINILQFSSIAQLCPTLCGPMDCSTPGLPVHHQLLEFIKTYVHWAGDAMKPSHLLSPPSSPTFNLSQNQGLFQWVSSLYQMPKVLEFQLQHQSFQRIFRTDFLWDGLVGSPRCPRDSQESSPMPQFKSINSSALSFL